MFFGVPCWIDSSCLRIVLTLKSPSGSMVAVLPPPPYCLDTSAESSLVCIDAAVPLPLLLTPLGWSFLPLAKGAAARVDVDVL